MRSSLPVELLEVLELLVLLEDDPAGTQPEYSSCEAAATSASCCRDCQWRVGRIG